MNNLFELTQIKSHSRVEVLLQGSVSAGFDASLDAAPSSLSGPIVHLQMRRWSGGHPPEATNSQLSTSWESPFPNLISTDCLFSLSTVGGFRLLKLQGLKGDPTAVFLVVFDTAQCADLLPRLLFLVAEIRHQQHSVTRICREGKTDSNSWGKTEDAMCFSQQRVKNFPWTLLSSTETRYMDPQDVLWNILFVRVL